MRSLIRIAESATSREFDVEHAVSEPCSDEDHALGVQSQPINLVEIKALPKYDTQPWKQFSSEAPLELPDREREAVEWYQGHGHTHINSKLRGTSPEWKMPTDDEMWNEYGFVMGVDEAIGHMDEVLARAPRRKRPLTVFRGERDPRRVEQLEAMEPGESYIDHGFLSTSLGPSYAFYSFAQFKGVNALSMIVVPPSVRGALLKMDVNEPSREMEFVIDRGCRYTLREKRMIPNRNRGHPVRELRLLVWDASR